MKRGMKNLPAEERRLVTIEAVVQLASERNPEQITTAAIAEKMRLTQGALFRHFPSKEALWEAVMQWVEQNLMSAVDQAVAGESAVADLERMFTAHIGFVSRHPGVPRMLFAELQRSEDTPAKKVARVLLQRYAKRVGALLEKGIGEGSIDPDLDVQAASGMFIGLVQGLVMQSLLSGSQNRMQDEAPKVLRLYLKGIAKE
ncbi:TetR/AcrR family transcriptional regulator [Chlorobaculum sp. 24CR]|uniref:TetR/AcrR family transcriptional regulator n=1 Tax=Chlorobaculum sp. 24CR TaxID=2508878 RepID=UPI00100B00CC|nr:TetR/AcrR family transcriptional regulator [Chlorobaculum sp. 24CR]